MNADLAKSGSAPLSCAGKRARWTLWLTFLGGSVFGLMFDWEALLPALRHQPYAYGSHTDASLIGLVFGGTLLPIAITFLAPRKSFLWAVAALLVHLAWSLLDRVAALSASGLLHDLRSNGSDVLGTLLVFCGPVSLVRLLLRRRHDGKSKRLAAQETFIQHAAEDQAGVWPPPIRRTGFPD